VKDKHTSVSRIGITGKECSSFHARWRSVQLQNTKITKPVTYCQHACLPAQLDERMTNSIIIVW